MLNADDDDSLARTRALRYLETRERSRREVEGRLRRYGYDELTVAAVVEWLEGLDYIDDKRFAATYTREKTRAGWGARRIRAGLSAAGISPTIAGEAVSAAAEVEAAEGRSSEESLAATVARRFGREWARDPAGAERRAGAFLQRRGHDWETIRRVVRAAFSDCEEQGFR